MLRNNPNFDDSEELVKGIKPWSISLDKYGKLVFPKTDIRNLTIKEAIGYNLGVIRSLDLGDCFLSIGLSNESRQIETMVIEKILDDHNLYYKNVNK